MSAVADQELYSLLVPLADERLIIPRACVAEVVRFTTPEYREGSENWMLGTISWGGRDLPVVAYEGMLGKEIPAATGRTRVVVFYATAGKLKTGFFGVITQGFPQLVRVNREVLKLESAEGWHDGAPVYCRVKMINEYPLVPNLEEVEKMIANEAVEV